MKISLAKKHSIVQALQHDIYPKNHKKKCSFLVFWPYFQWKFFLKKNILLSDLKFRRLSSLYKKNKFYNYSKIFFVHSKKLVVYNKIFLVYKKKT